MPVEWQSWATRRFGDLYTAVNLVFGVQVSTSDPELIKQVFTGDPNVFHAGEGNAPLIPIVGSRSVLVLDGDEHLRRRRLVMPPFHGERMQAHTDTMLRVTEEMIRGWRPGHEMSLYPSMQQLTLEVILRAVFGLSTGPRLDDFRERMTALLARVQSATGMLLMVPALQRDLGPLTPWAAFKRELDHVDAFVYAEIAERRAEPADANRNDVLSLLVRARDEDGGSLSDAEIHDDLMTLVIAGHESTATELCWAFAEILTHPEVEARLLAEIDEKASLLPGRIAELEYLDAVVKETLRLHPVIGNLGRRIKESVTLRNHEIPKETIVSPSIVMTQRRADLYPEPEAFKPERFLGKKTDHSMYLPFGGGARRCLGAAFALYEMKVVLATVLGRVRLQSIRRTPPRTVLRSLAFAPAGGTRVRIDGWRAPGDPFRPLAPPSVWDRLHAAVTHHQERRAPRPA